MGSIGRGEVGVPLGSTCLSGTKDRNASRLDKCGLSLSTSPFFPPSVSNHDYSAQREQNTVGTETDKGEKLGEISVSAGCPGVGGGNNKFKLATYV